MKIKNKNCKKYKHKKIYLFQTKIGTRNKNPAKSGKIRKNPKKSFQIFSQKIYHFLIDFHSLTPAAVLFPLEQSLILFNKSHSQALCSQCLSARPRG